MNDSNVSVIICTRNNKKNIGRVVENVIRENPYELIVVDGNSTDGTREIVEKLPVKMITDPGKGLAFARKMALEVATGDYILFIGDDNLIKQGSINRLKNYIVEKKWCGAAYQTRIINPEKSYWSFCSNLRWKIRFKEGERAVVGTPYMFEASLLKAANYDEKCGDADDADMEYRLAKLTNKKFGYSNQICFEIGRNDFSAMIERFRRYGKSDYEYWMKYSPNWNFMRKIKSLLHPFMDELVVGIKGVEPFSLKMYSIPYFFAITFLRYQGWIKTYLKGMKE